jgi:predicted AlkP superfamily phosphohydrolase/phosphomutase
MSGRPRVAVVGVDGFSPGLMDELVRTGRLPSIGSLSQGASARIVPTLPATTPVAWASLMTGAMPAVTGIEGFLVHQTGDPLDQRVSGCYSYRCRAQPLWEAASAAAKSAYVVKFPVSYPSATATFRLDGAAGWGGLTCLHEVASRSVRSFDPEPADAMPYDASTGLIARWSWSIANLWGAAPVTLGLALREQSGGGLVVDVTAASGQLMASLEPGRWSEPLTLPAEGRRGATDVSFRVKVLSCSRDPVTLRVVNTALHERSGHAVPDEIWQDYLRSVGPIEEQTEPSLVLSGELDLESQLELFDLNVDWLRRVSTYVLSKDEPDLFLVHVHVIDWAHHMLEGGIDPRHPDFDPVRAPEFERALMHAYELVDGLVADVREAAGQDADVIVVGDHGQDLVHTTFRVNEWLARRGLLQWRDEDGGAVVWAKTRAYATGNYVYLNVAGREPHGVVDPADVPQLIEELVGGLLTFTDPRNGSRPVLVAGPKEHFERLGAHGAGVGDIVFCLSSGYQATNVRGQELAPTRLLRDFTSNHDHFWPLDPRIQTRLFAAGPHFRTGVASRVLADATDVAPTICAVLGVDPPQHSSGRVLHELLAQRSAVTVPAVVEASN